MIGKATLFTIACGFLVAVPVLQLGPKSFRLACESRFDKGASTATWRRLGVGSDDTYPWAVSSLLDAAYGSVKRRLGLELDDTYTRIPAASLPAQPTFLFIHLEKSAGSMLGTVFKEALPQAELNYHNCCEPITHVPQNYFVVSSIRNPCIQVLSQWSYCCEKAWVWKEWKQWDTAAPCGEHSLQQGICPYFTGEKEKYASREYREHSHSLRIVKKNIPGFSRHARGAEGSTYEVQFNSTFKAISPDRVNCWVRLENLVNDARRCVRQFELFTGNKANWKLLEHRLKGMANVGNHGKCNAYFNQSSDLSAELAKKNAFLFNYFGYVKCC